MGLGHRVYTMTRMKQILPGRYLLCAMYLQKTNVKQALCVYNV